MIKFQFEKDSENRVKELLNEFKAHTGLSLGEAFTHADPLLLGGKKILLTNPRKTDDWIEVTACDNSIGKFKILWQLLDKKSYIKVQASTFTCKIKLKIDYLDFDDEMMISCYEFINSI